jgi:two-component system, OmpR family, sensor histidine kinase TctE
MRRKLVLWVLLPLVSLVALSTAVTYQLARSAANDCFDSFLLNSADSIQARLSVNHKGIVVSDLPSLTQANVRHNGKDHFYYQIVDSSGHKLKGEDGFPAAHMVRHEGARFRNGIIYGEPVRICRVPTVVGTTTLWVRVAETFNSRDRLLGGIFWSILVPQIVLVGLCCLSAWYGISRGLKPLHQLGAVLKSRTQPDLSPVDIGPVPMELTPVLEALNELFSRVDHHFRLQKEFVANAAHQLRTPVTAVRTYTDHLLLNHTAAPSPEVVAKLDEATNRVTHLISRLLILARAEADGVRRAGSADLIEAVNAAAGAVVHEAIEKNVELHFAIPAHPVVVEADVNDLTEMIINLLDNAVQYSGKGRSAWLTVKEAGHGAVLTVEDDGPGIPTESKDRVFDRFYRLPGTGVGGSGLGLAIVKEIATAINADIQLLDRQGGGTIFNIVFSGRTARTTSDGNLGEPLQFAVKRDSSLSTHDFHYQAPDLQ